MGWEQLQNGDLLHAAGRADFEVFVTGDQSLAYQQNLPSRTIANAVLTKNNWPSVEPTVAKIVAAVDSAMPGTYQIVECFYLFQGPR